MYTVFFILQIRKELQNSKNLVIYAKKQAFYVFYW